MTKYEIFRENDGFTVATVKAADSAAICVPDGHRVGIARDCEYADDLDGAGGMAQEGLEMARFGICRVSDGFVVATVKAAKSTAVSVSEGYSVNFAGGPAESEGENE